jgi:protein MpaA
VQQTTSIFKVDLSSPPTQALRQLATSAPQILSRRNSPSFHQGEEDFCVESFVFAGPESGGDRMRLGFFAGLHGDEPAGVYALIRFLWELCQQPDIATGYEIVAVPICNPYGCIHRTRASFSGYDLNREFWRGSTHPEVIFLEELLREQTFHGIVSLHADDCSDGLYGFVDGATLARDLLEPALQAAEQFLPRNRAATIDSFAALDGILQQGYGGVLSAPPGTKPRPFEIVFETPERAPLDVQVEAHCAAIRSIVENYRAFMAHANSI